MKKSVVLLATLFFVMVLMALVAINTQLTKKGLALSDNTKFMMQINILLKDVTHFLTQKAAFIKDPKILALLISSDMKLDVPKASLFINVDMDSNAKRLNINKIEPETDNQKAMTKPYYKLFYDILQHYNVGDMELFLSLIRDTIDSDSTERAFESEIVLLQDDFENGGIYSMSHFKQIVDIYKKRSGDFEIDKVPWKELIQFNGDKIDINYMSPKLLGIILNQDESEAKRLQDENSPITDMGVLVSPEDKKRLEAIGVKPFVPNIEVEVSMNVFERDADAIFSYDLKTKKASDVRVKTQYVR